MHLMFFLKLTIAYVNHVVIAIFFGSKNVIVFVVIAAVVTVVLVVLYKVQKERIF